MCVCVPRRPNWFGWLTNLTQNNNKHSKRQTHEAAHCQPAIGAHMDQLAPGTHTSLRNRLTVDWPHKASIGCIHDFWMKNKKSSSLGEEILSLPLSLSPSPRGSIHSVRGKWASASPVRTLTKSPQGKRERKFARASTPLASSNRHRSNELWHFPPRTTRECAQKPACAHRGVKNIMGAFPPAPIRYNLATNTPRFESICLSS